MAHGGIRAGAGRRRSRPIAPGPDILRWHCVRTNPGAELTADIEIRLAGFTVFAPTIFKPATPARRDSRGVVCPARPDRIEPLFRRYLFVQFRRSDLAWRAISGLPGVERVLCGTPEAPIAVPDRSIALIRGLCAPNGCIYPATGDATPFAVALPAGEAVRVLTGPMSGVAGVCQWSDGHRVRLQLSIMGATASVTLAQAAVEAA